MQAEFERYQRQIILKEFGKAGQQKLLDAKVLVVGAGGLGCPALLYLAAAGVGIIGIADDDVVSLSNLHRQVLFTADDIGKSKTLAAANRLQQLNADIHINAHQLRLNNANAFNTIQQYDIVIDGTDNFASKYLINDACVLLNKTLVYGAVSKFEGQVAVLNAEDKNGIRCNYRDLFATPPAEKILSCAEEGVLGVTAGIIGTMQAAETIKLITGIGKPLINQMLMYNALDNSLYKFNLSFNGEAQTYIPKDEAAFLNMDYSLLCSSQINNELEIDYAGFNKFINDKNITIIDVREKDEHPFINEFNHLQIPISELMMNQNLINTDKVIVFCQSGKRSLQAVKILNEVFNQTKKIVSLKDGIAQWKSNK